MIVVRQIEFVLPLLEWCEIAAGGVTIEGVTCDVPAFSMAKYPVTYAQYEAFVNDGGYRNRAHWTDAGWGWKGDTTLPAFWGDPTWHVHDRPVNGVTWYEAHAYTRWLSAETELTIALPTEAQWQRAAQGDDGREYPWGNGFDETRCNTVESAIGTTTPVTQYLGGASPFGVLDMSGNVWEWCLSRWAQPYRLPEDTLTEGAGVRVQRGGAFDFTQRHARATARDDTNASNRRNHDGFRVVWVVGG
jgi:formylglycine-generating enzyme required for sulfatase activity